jgi:hypothetical protein
MLSTSDTVEQPAPIAPRFGREVYVPIPVCAECRQSFRTRRRGAWGFEEIVPVASKSMSVPRVVPRKFDVLRLSFGGILGVKLTVKRMFTSLLTDYRC